MKFIEETNTIKWFLTDDNKKIGYTRKGILIDTNGNKLEDQSILWDVEDAIEGIGVKCYECKGSGESFYGAVCGHCCGEGML